MLNISTSLADRDLRQRDLIPPARLAECHAWIIGVGAVGRQVALQLAAIGIPKMTLVDPDYVSAENLAPQGYWAEDLRKPKVEVTAFLCKRLNPAIDTQTRLERFKRSHIQRFRASERTVVFLCVDSIAARAWIWESVQGKAALVLDGRMSAEVIRVLAVVDPLGSDYYRSTLFAPEQAFAGSCTAKATIYAASIAAGLMLCQFSKWLRGIAVDEDQTFNLLAGEWSVFNSAEKAAHNS